MAKFTESFKISSKHLQIDKANTNILIAASVTTAIVIFSVVAAQALINQMKYQSKVIGLRSKAASQLSKNVTAAKTLNEAYIAFDGSPESVIGNSEKNSKVVLNALPSKYDFPALATSLQGIINNSGNKGSVTGTDDEANALQTSASPQTVDIPFQMNATGTTATIQQLLSYIERSIRPIKISQISISGSDTSLQVSLTAKTYYQPEKQLEYKDVIVPGGGSATKAATTTQPTTSTGGASK